MTNKPIKREVNAPNNASAVSYESQVDAFIERNRDALSESIQRGHEEFARGIFETRTVEEIIADGRKRHRSAS